MTPANAKTMQRLLRDHSASCRNIYAWVIDALTDGGAEELHRRLDDGWALSLHSTITTPPAIFGLITKPGSPAEEVFRLVFADAKEKENG